MNTSESATTGGIAAASPIPVNAPAFNLPTVRIQRIVVPVDFSPQTAKAVTYAQSLAMAYGAAITLLHVFTPPFAPYDPMLGTAILPIIETAREQARDQLNDLCNTVAQEVSVPVDARLLEGPIHVRIAEACKESKADLIIIPTHGYTGLQHLLHLGSTAERVVRYAPCPVMVVRDLEHDFIQS